MAYLVEEQEEEAHHFYIAVPKCMDDGTTQGIIIKY